MMRFIRPRPRLRMPVRMAALGAVAAAAFAAGPGPRTLGIAFAIITGGIAAGCAIAAYVRGREDSDLGAIYGSRADERQKLIRLQARGLAQCHLAYLPTTALTCRFVSDRQSSRQRRPERICAGQSDKEGQGILEDQLRLSGIGAMSRISPSAAASTTSPSRPRRTTASMRSTPTRPAPGRRSGRPALLPSGATAVPNGLTSCANAQKARFGAGQLPGVMVVLSTRTRVRFLVACGTPPTLISPGEQCDHFQVQHKDDAEHCSEDCRAWAQSFTRS